MNLLGTTGQERRNWLGNVLADAAYFVPPNLRPWGQVATAMNPVNDALQSMEAAGRGDWVGSAVNAAPVVAPMVGGYVLGRMGGGVVDDAARFAEEALTGIGYSPSVNALADMGQRFAYDEDGAIRAWHGSPHDFDRFSMDKIGTGEGAQAYGHGLYFAESPDVARAYREALAPSTDVYTINGQPVDWDMLGDPEKTALGMFRPGRDPQGLLAKVEQAAESAGGGTPYQQRLIAALRDYMGKDVSYTEAPSGRLYEVEIAANPEDFLDWDAPLSAQPEKVRGWFDSRGISEGFAGNQRGVELFQAERRAFDDEAALAASMKDAGLAGVQYLDHGSRFNAMDGLGPQTNTRNYVVFDDNLITILNKYGLAGLAAYGGYNALAPYSEQGGI
jgi:hypothetical protein